MKTATYGTRKATVRFQQLVYSPGDIIIRRGEEGAEMFFIVKGAVEIFDDKAARPDGFQREEDDFNDGPLGKYLAMKGKGEFFGEVALVREERLSSFFASCQAALSFAQPPAGLSCLVGFVA